MDPEQPAFVPVLVTTDVDLVPVAECLVALAGYVVGIGWDLPPAPWVLAHERIACSGTVADDAAAALAVEAAVRGAGVIVLVERGWGGRARLVEALRREHEVEDWSVDTPAVARLDPDDLTLLHLLARGSTVAAAAREVHCSERSAHRRLVEARARLGCGTTTEAALMVGGVVDRWVTR